MTLALHMWPRDEKNQPYSFLVEHDGSPRAPLRLQRTHGRGHTGGDAGTGGMAAGLRQFRVVGRGGAAWRLGPRGALVRQVLDGSLKSRKEIKAAVKNWKADHQRI